MRIRATIAAGLLAASSVAFGVAGLGSVDTAADTTIDAFKLQTGDVVDTTAIGTLLTGDDLPAVQATDNIALVAELETGASTDIMFQRREGEQVLRGETIDAVKDYAFVGTVSGEDGFRVVDVTNPREPELLASVACGGFHNDIIVYEQYVVIGHDGGAVKCDGAGVPSGAGIWIFDVTDPANPEFVHSVGQNGFTPSQKLTQATHNISLNPRSGHVYYSTAGFHAAPLWGAFSLEGDVTKNQSVELSMRDLTNGDATTAADGCHDQGLAFDVEDATGATRDFIFCAAIGTTIIWDITEDPLAPKHVSTIVNPGINIHHGARLAPDGVTLVLNDELAGAAAGTCTAGAPTGTLFAYDFRVPEAPVALGYGSAPDLPNLATCTSHFYNFVSPEQNDAGAQLTVTGWYSGGAIVHDFTRAAGAGPIGAAPVFAQATPQDARMWTAYAYRGFLYSASYSGNTGFFVYELEGYDAEGAEPLPYDEGTSWGPWTGGTDA